jgi:hypothetical protein
VSGPEPVGQLGCFVSARTARVQSATATATITASRRSKYYKYLDIYEDSVEFWYGNGTLAVGDRRPARLHSV